MAEDNTKLSDLKSKVLLAKLLLLKYGILHSFHSQQLQYYVIGCCNITIDGSAQVAADKKLVKYELFTEKYYYKKMKKTIKRSKLDAFFAMWPSKYKKECKDAYANLDMWCKELLWGDETTVVVEIDGVRVYGK
jgi:hypothetical protein